MRLLEMREGILALKDARKNSQQTVELDQARVGRLSRMDALQQQAMAQASQRSSDRMLARIEAALRRCDSGRFGRCSECDELVAVKRLHIDPTSTRCIGCAQR
jgi:DnaK suppressor protein